MTRPRSRRLVCRQLVEKVSAYLDGDLGDRERRAVEEHLEGCDGCSGYVAQVRRLLELTALEDGPSLPEDLVRSLTARFVTVRAGTATP